MFSIRTYVDIGMIFQDYITWKGMDGLGPTVDLCSVQTLRFTNQLISYTSARSRSVIIPLKMKLKLKTSLCSIPDSHESVSIERAITRFLHPPVPHPLYAPDHNT